MASMQELLLNLQSADKGTRTHAEAVYNSMLQEQRDQVRKCSVVNARDVLIFDISSSFKTHNKTFKLDPKQTPTYKYLSP